MRLATLFLAGPEDTIRLPPRLDTDWEAELAVVGTEMPGTGTLRNSIRLSDSEEPSHAPV